MGYLDIDDAESGNFRDLRDLGELHDELGERLQCTYCGEPVKVIIDGDPGQPSYFHEISDKSLCPLDDEEDEPTRATLADPLDDQEQRVYDAITDLIGHLGDDGFRHGGAMIIDHEWEDYARETAEDTGMIDADSAMAAYVDWEKWGEALAMDYTSVTFLGRDYYVQAY